MIAIEQVSQKYGGSQILWDLNLELQTGVCNCIMGRNGVGKTTLLKALMGLLPISSGSIHFDNSDIADWSTERRVRAGLGYVPQGRDIFPQLTVEENLQLGLPVRRDGLKTIPDRIYELFPVLADMLQRRGGDLSGGQQQQLAIGRALVMDPKVLLLDEPNEGIQPNIVEQIGKVIRTLVEDDGLTVVLVEQKITFARKVADHFNLMDKGRVVASDPMAQLSDDMIRQYLSV